MAKTARIDHAHLLTPAELSTLRTFLCQHHFFHALPVLGYLMEKRPISREFWQYRQPDVHEDAEQGKEGEDTFDQRVQKSPSRGVIFTVTETQRFSLFSFSASSCAQFVHDLSLVQDKVRFGFCGEKDLEVIKSRFSQVGYELPCRLWVLEVETWHGLGMRVPAIDGGEYGEVDVLSEEDVEMVMDHWPYGSDRNMGMRLVKDGMLVLVCAVC